MPMFSLEHARDVQSICFRLVHEEFLEGHFVLLRKILLRSQKL